MARVPDPDLHARMLAGDEGALATFDEQSGPGVRGWLVTHRGVSPEDAEEIWQDVLSAVWRQVARIDPNKLTGYAHEAAVFKAASRYRKDRRRPEADALSLEEYMAADDIEQRRSTPESDAVKRLRDCLARVSERVRTVAGFLMAGGGTREIARIFKVKEDSAYQIKARALRALRDCIEGGAS